jgi:hypothetical protein
MAISHVVARPETIRGSEMFRREVGESASVRTKEEITAFFEGFELESPGLVQVSRWRPGFGCGGDRGAWCYAGVGRKPSTGGTLVAG